MAIVALAAGSVNASPPALDGVWRSHGWDLVYQIRGSTLQAFEVTNTTCVQAFQAKRLSPETPGRDATFRTRDGDVFYIAPEGDADHKRVLHPTGLTTIALERLPALPQICAPPTPNTPTGNFDVFAQTFAEQYISFDLRHVDWERVVAEQRANITAQTTLSQLFEILKAMIQPLADLHTGIEAPKLKRNFDPTLRPGTDRVVGGHIDRFARTGRRQLEAITNRAYLQGPLLSFCRGQWQYGMAANGIGYLRILSFGDYSWHGGSEGGQPALDRSLDRILSDPKLHGLLIDVRLSFGGDDRLGLAIASRLTTQEYMAYAIQVHADPAEPVIVRPGHQPLFSGPVVELIGPITMSAAETFTQALMERTPRIIRIGENTQGVFCDPLGRHLPNGWTFELPNAVYRTSNGNAFDVAGVPPDLPVPVFAKDDVTAGRDPAMAAAIQLLSPK
jgi:hypothetical protein